MTGEEVLMELLWERMIVIGGVFLALLILVLVTAWALRARRR
jgi:cytochrome c oxidase subunit IV